MALEMLNPEWNLSPKLIYLWTKTQIRLYLFTKRIDLLRGHNWVHSAHLAIVYCYTDFKLCYPKNLKSFLIRVKELLEPIFLQTKVVAFLLFLKSFSLETDLWVTLGDFAVKNAKLGREICIYLKND